MRIVRLITMLALLALVAEAGEKPKGKARSVAAPTLANVSYGKHSRNVLDFWKAEGKGPRPVVIMIHGGGWLNGDKRSAARSAAKYVKLGISFVAVNYRLAGKDRLPAPVHDAARGVQFVRHKAKEWNVDTSRIALTGGSAGGCSSVWILLHDDMRDPKSEDHVLRESTRVCAAAVGGAQTTIDPKVIKEWVGEITLKHAMLYRPVGARSKDDVVTNYAKYEKLIQEFSPVNHLDKSDPPLFMKYRFTGTPKSVNAAIHHANFGIKLKEKSDKLGHECYLVYPGCRKQKYPDALSFLKDKLLGRQVTSK
jgi:acetyl esterase/lipase